MIFVPGWSTYANHWKSSIRNILLLSASIDEVLQRTYEKELKIGSLITLFSLVAIFISIVGVFDLVVFESEYKRKEIAVRKVLGSTTGEILYRFNVSYFWILLICFVFGAPVAWYGMHR
mgnify:FL=1|nr:FtsX-like permease family protein [Parabacteroides merdae]